MRDAERKTKERLFIIIFLYFIVGSNAGFAQQAKNDYYIPTKPITKLSEAASALGVGMTQVEVISRIGKPTWVILPKERISLPIPVDADNINLLWQNGPCNPVIVAFKNKKVVGIDEGRMLCYKSGSYPNKDLPNKTYMCAGERSKYCR